MTVAAIISIGLLNNFLGVMICFAAVGSRNWWTQTAEDDIEVGLFRYCVKDECEAHKGPSDDLIIAQATGAMTFFLHLFSFGFFAAAMMKRRVRTAWTSAAFDTIAFITSIICLAKAVEIKSSYSSLGFSFYFFVAAICFIILSILCSILLSKSLSSTQLMRVSPEQVSGMLAPSGKIRHLGPVAAGPSPTKCSDSSAKYIVTDAQVGVNSGSAPASNSSETHNGLPTGTPNGNGLVSPKRTLPPISSAPLPAVAGRTPLDGLATIETSTANTRNPTPVPTHPSLTPIDDVDHTDTLDLPSTVGAHRLQTPTRPGLRVQHLEPSPK
eukprot:Rmarinus@m.16711